MLTHKFDASSFITDIVTHDYRAAEVFRKYDIDFCTGGKLSLDVACKNKGLDTDAVLKELKQILRHANSSTTPEFAEWNIDFLADYILNVHHRYLNKALPEVHEYVNRLSEGHNKEFPELLELGKIMKQMMKEIPPHMRKEEEVIFPYIKQIFHAWRHRESYASLLIRTLRKPVEEVMQGEHESVGRQLHRIREITHNYSIPANSGMLHRVTYAKLQEVDNDLVQHIHLENNILFPKAIALEKELLLFKD